MEIKKLPNYLTIFRMILVPIILSFLIWDFYLFANSAIISDKFIAAEYFNITLTIPFLISGLIFIIAAITDLIDGYVARKYDAVTDFGKIFDPSADKILINSVLIMMAISTRLPIWIPIIMIARDVLVDASRIFLSKNNVVVPANIWGKLKTVFQLIGLILLFFIFPLGFIIDPLSNNFATVAENWWILFPMYIAVVFSIISGVVYLDKVLIYLKDNKKQKVEMEKKNE